MSLNAILGSANSALLTSQLGLRTVSDNIANINTPGYARRVLDQQPLASGGVEAAAVRRVVDQFLRQASLGASADAGAAAALAEVFDRAQSLFGDPASANSYFGRLEQAWQGFSAAALDPASGAGRTQALAALSAFLDESRSISDGIAGLGAEAERRLSGKLTEANDLLRRIDELNTSISRTGAGGGDVSPAQNAQAQLIDRLSQLMDVSVTSDPNGRITLRTGAGGLLLSEGGPAALSYVAEGAAPGRIVATSAGGAVSDVMVRSGELKGLLDLRNVELPALSRQLSGYVDQAVEEINRAHNASTAAPPPPVLTGRNTGLDLPTAVSGFTGRTTVAVVDAAGVIQRRVDIDFDAGTMSVDGGAPSGFTSGGFLGGLNAALGGFGSASFAGGALSLSAASGGVAVADDPANPSAKAGRGFSQFFGLNDLVTSTGFPAATGLRASDPHGFAAGGQLRLRLSDANGGSLRDVAVTVPAGGTMADLLAALNSSASGVGLYGGFSLDADGRLAFAGNGGVQLSLLDDTTQRGAGGPSVSQLFGLGARAATSAGDYALRKDIAAAPSRLAAAQLNLAAAAGTSALSPGDGRGLLALAAAGEASISVSGAQTTLGQLAAQLAGTVGGRAAAAQARLESAEAVSAEAATRRSSHEGVNLDEELVQLTTYQQAYNASARLIQAVKEMYDVLLQIA
ncbi:MAG TPA: flagellar basal body rod C-terminal domain-containing protein [Caulobacteraceae bacterium]|jgi:flagellar hook-associated protein 1 FlgK